MTEGPGYGADRLLRGLSLPRRVGYVLAGLAGLAGATMIGVLWATEPTRLPARTGWAFAGLMGVGVVWAVLAGWMLVRRPLFALDRVVAAALAVCFSAVTTVAAIGVAAARAGVLAVVAAAGVGVTLTAVAVVVWVRARAYRAGLLARERELIGEGAVVKTGNRLPIGPLALAMRRRGDGFTHRRIVIAAVVLGLALAIGLALLLR